MQRCAGRSGKGRRWLAAALLVAVAAGLAGTWAVIGLRRRNASPPPAQPGILTEAMSLIAQVAPPAPTPPLPYRHTPLPPLNLPPQPIGPRVQRVSFPRDVQPILAASCYSCHGPDTRRAAGGLRLDVRARALKSAIVPGNAARSLLLEKVAHADPAARMPPAAAHKPALTQGQVEVLRRWIDEGAVYEDHWAFVPPERPAVPGVRNRSWVRNPIDAFIAAGQEKQGLKPAAEADRRTLISRVSYDLTGLLPTPAEVAAFVHGPPEAYEELVDRLLASPRFGERMAVLWLDLVRYADTDGYSRDQPRTVWPFRDWVIDAFNGNMPFDQFTIRQIAGDLLPEPTADDRVASGYNRLLMTSSEACANDEERRCQYLADRVRNVAAVWLGLTLGCAECHDHKFDPLTARNFYRLGAFFADIQEKGVGEPEPTFLGDSSQEAMLAWHDTVLQRLEEKLRALPGLDEALRGLAARVQAGTAGDDVPDDILSALKAKPEERTPALVRRILWHFRPDIPGLNPLLVSALNTEVSRRVWADKFRMTLTTTSGPRRVVRVLRRGNFQDKSGEVVSPDLPEVLCAGRPLGEHPTRLDLARWLVSRDNPLAARVFVNHLWKIAFGRGLVASAADFGTRGSPPTTPELLDWLAVEFMDRGWDVKALLKWILTSNTYRQSSLVSPGERERDPRNTWLARQNSFRFDAEFIRDNALAAAGLLAGPLGGPSVRPYQPEGYWVEQGYSPSAGQDQHRRGLYTYWCRNALHPALLLFDAAPRRACTAERVRSATPLQSLALLNDPSCTEAARALACRILREAPPSRCLDHAFALVLSREPGPRERTILEDLYEKHRDEFRRDGLPADAAEVAAWTSVMRAILNLHETVTRY